MIMINEITQGDCLEIVKEIPDEGLDAVVIDPPYGEGMCYDGDGNIYEAESLLVNFLRLIEPKIKRNGHIAIFWTMRNLDVCIDTLRSNGFMYRRTLSMYLPKGNARPYLGWLPRTQAIVIGQKYLPKQPTEFHSELVAYLSEYLIKSGLSKSELAKKLNCDSRLVMKWTRVGDPAWCLPTPRFYKPLKEILKLDDTFDILLTREPAKDSNRKDYEYKHDTYVVSDKNEVMVHPSQKPLSVLEHVVSCLCPEEGLVLDGFAGSGTTGVACKRINRNFICIEKSEEFCNVARQRLYYG